MSRWTAYGTMLGLMLTAGLAGCAEKPPVERAPDTSAADRQRIAELEGQLRDAQAARLGDANRMTALQRELEALRQKLAEKPEPTPPPNWASVPGGAMTSIEGTVLFDSGKAMLKPGARETLDAIAQVISDTYPDYDIYVFGHTDNEPIKHSPWKDNYELSCQRSLSVVRYLRDRLSSGNISAGGWGEYRPAAENDTAANRQANRRVEIYAMRPQENAPAGRSNPPRGGTP
jgi:flagellar motor protein MotB